jgi:hypothetical protein
VVAVWWLCCGDLRVAAGRLRMECVCARPDGVAVCAITASATRQMEMRGRVMGRFRARLWEVRELSRYGVSLSVFHWQIWE